MELVLASLFNISATWSSDSSSGGIANRHIPYRSWIERQECARRRTGCIRIDRCRCATEIMQLESLIAKDSNWSKGAHVALATVSDLLRHFDRC